jgi:hypothetical protein
VSSPAAVSALEKASPTDLVQLSEAAMQLEGLNEMFGIQNGIPNGSGATNLENLLNGAVGASLTLPATTAAATAAAAAPASSTTSSAPSLADQLAGFQLASQTSEVQTLFDPGGTGGLSNSFLNLIA